MTGFWRRTAHGSASWRLVLPSTVLMVLLTTASAKTQPIPPLLDVPRKIASLRGDLLESHQRLLREREILRSRVDSHNTQCRAVEKGSAEDAACIQARTQLADAVKSHSNESNVFNAKIREAKAICVKTAGLNLAIDLRECDRDSPSITSYECILGHEAGEKVLACLAALPAGKTSAGKVAALAACGVAITVPLDAEARCPDIASSCVTRKLQEHRQGVFDCEH